MKILLTGATGYIGRRLLPLLIEEGHEVFCLVRDPSKLKNIIYNNQSKMHFIQADLEKDIPELPKDLDAAYYLIHSMCDDPKEFEKKERLTAKHFLQALLKTKTQQVIYLGGLITANALSPHLRSRQKVERILHTSPFFLTAIRAGVIIGSSSASFEIIRDLGEKLPLMIAPKWVHSLCQPIGIDDALYYLLKVLGKKAHYQKTYDIGGPDILTYGQMLQIYSKTRKLKRFILQVPVLTPRLSSYWLYFITSTNLSLAKALIESLKNNAICTEDSIHSLIPHRCKSYQETVERALSPIAQTSFFSTLEEAKKAVIKKPYLQDLIRVPRHGCYRYTVGSCEKKELNTFVNKHPKWMLIKNSPNNIIFYKKNRTEYWIEYLLKDNYVQKIYWNRPRGLYQRLKWFLYLGVLKIFGRKIPRYKAFIINKM